MYYSNLVTPCSKELESIQQLEKELGTTLLAFANRDIQVVNLSDENVAKVKALEEKLNMTLIAVKA